MGKVEDHLIIRIGVNRRHRSADDFELIVHYLRYRRQAVRGARCIRNNVMLRGIVLVVVHSQHERDVLILGGSRNNDLFHPGGAGASSRRLHP